MREQPQGRTLAELAFARSSWERTSVFRLVGHRGSVIRVDDVGEEQPIAWYVEELGQACLQERRKRPGLAIFESRRRLIAQRHAESRSLVHDERDQLIIVRAQWTQRPQRVLKALSIHPRLDSPSSARDTQRPRGLEGRQ